ncbi:MAG TPA: restriction endonuclease subunit S [Telluria sp.]
MHNNFNSLPLGSIAHIEMGQSPDSSSVFESDRLGVPFLQGNAEFGAVGPVPRFSCIAPMKMCQAGDILVSVRAPVGALNIADRDYCIGRGLAAIRITGMPAPLLARLLGAATAALRRVAQGTTFEAISKSDLLSLGVFAPPACDYSELTHVIDTLETTILQTEAIIDKLTQAKQGMLHDLLTRGINENGELRAPQIQAPHLYKDSPIGWIPSSWKSEVVGRVLHGTPRNGLYKPAKDIGAGVLLVGQTAFTRDGSVNFTEARRASVGGAELSAYGLCENDLLVSRVFATREGVGQPVLVPMLSEPAVYESNMMRLRLRQGVLEPQLMFHWLKGRAARSWIMARAFASNQASINREALCSMPVPLPPLGEQVAMLQLTQACDDRIKSETHALEKLRKLKDGLMGDLLTGRVRVTPTGRALAL